METLQDQRKLQVSDVGYLWERMMAWALCEYGGGLWEDDEVPRAEAQPGRLPCVAGESIHILRLTQITRGLSSLHPPWNPKNNQS